MNFLRDFFLQDIGRKVLALAIALLFWWRVNTSLESEHLFPFRIVTSGGAPGQHEIKIDVPEGWILVDPKPNSTHDFTFYGSQKKFQDFLNTQCAATVNATIVQPGNQDSTSFARRPSEFSWLRPDQARALLREKDNAPLSFKFERHDFDDYLLDPSWISVAGSPPLGFVLKQEEIQFTPNAVEIHGSIGVRGLVESFNLNQGLFKELTLPEGSNRDVKRTLQLSAQALDEGMWMDPPKFDVHLPIRAQASEPVEWRPKKPILIGQAPDGGNWTFNWIDAPWVATFEPFEGANFQLDDLWLQRNVQLMVHLDQLPDDAVQGYELLLDWHIIGEGNFENLEQLNRLKQAISIRPKQEDDRQARTVTMNKEEG